MEHICCALQRNQFLHGCVSKRGDFPKTSWKNGNRPKPVIGGGFLIQLSLKQPHGCYVSRLIPSLVAPGAGTDPSKPSRERNPFGSSAALSNRVEVPKLFGACRPSRPFGSVRMAHDSRARRKDQNFMVSPEPHQNSMLCGPAEPRQVMRRNFGATRTDFGRQWRRQAAGFCEVTFWAPLRGNCFARHNGQVPGTGAGLEGRGQRSGEAHLLEERRHG